MSKMDWLKLLLSNQASMMLICLRKMWERKHVHISQQVLGTMQDLSLEYRGWEGYWYGSPIFSDQVLVL
jgi:hypothetical protein